MVPEIPEPCKSLIKTGIRCLAWSLIHTNLVKFGWPIVSLDWLWIDLQLLIKEVGNSNLTASLTSFASMLQYDSNFRDLQQDIVLRTGSNSR
jgi:hypothetical protein